MSIRTRSLRLATFVLVVVALLALTAVAFAQDGQGDEDEAAPAVCNPVAAQLAETVGLDCTELLDLQASGTGLGEILKAWKLSQVFSGFQEDWETLLQAKQAGVGWGQFKMAYRLGAADDSAQMLLEKKQEGYGWGQLRKAQALAAAAGIDFEAALTEVTTMTWEEIQAGHESLMGGPPPWAGGGKDKDNQGPPPWANGGKGTDDGSTAPGLGRNKEGKTTGPPPWSNAGGRQSQDDETQESPDD
jgi:hypothetical protein